MSNHPHSFAPEHRRRQEVVDDVPEQVTPPQYSRPLPKEGSSDSNPLDSSSSFDLADFAVPLPSGRPPSWLAKLPPGPKETPTQSIRKKHRSVRSLTKEYESSAPCALSSSSPLGSAATTPSPHSGTYDPFNSRPNTKRATPDSKVASSSPSSVPASAAPLSPRNSNSLAAASTQMAEEQHKHSHQHLPTLAVSLDDDQPGAAAGSSGGLGRSKSHVGHHERTPSGSLDTDLPRPQDEENDSLGELGRSQSLSTRKSLSQMSAAERREHSRKHSRVHSRNLSVFFPQPGTEAEVEQDRYKVGMNFSNGGGQPAGALRPPISVDTAFGGSGDTQLPSADSLMGGDSSSAFASPSPTKSRRGHHSKHSVSYQQHQLLSPIKGGAGGMTRDSSNESLAWSEALSRSASLQSNVTPHEHSPAAHAHSHDHHHGHHHHGHEHHSHSHVHKHEQGGESAAKILGFFPRLPPLPPQLAPTFAYSLAHFLLGSSLWVSGQSTDLLSVTGMGYLVVFDSLGSFNDVLAQWVGSVKGRSHGKDRHRVAEAYSTQRVGTLLNFVQTIYLLFAAVYVCKESIEHVLLEGGESEAAAAEGGVDGGSLNVAMGGGAGHHHHDGLVTPSGPLSAATNPGTQLPTVLLVLATVACLFANLFMANHASLVAASGLSTSSSPSSQASRRRAHGRSASVLVSTSQMAAGPFLSLLSNPFSLTVLFFSSSLLFAALSLSPLQVQALDKVLAGLESVAMWYVALPASKVLGKVLLQTAPNVSKEEGGRAQLVQLMRATKALEVEPLIEHIAAPNVWQLTPSTSAYQGGTKHGKSGGAGSLGSLAAAAASLGVSSTHSTSSTQKRTAQSPSLIASISILLRDEAQDDDVLRITRWAYERGLRLLLRLSMGMPMGIMITRTAVVGMGMGMGMGTVTIIITFTTMTTTGTITVTPMTTPSHPHTRTTPSPVIISLMITTLKSTRITITITATVRIMTSITTGIPTITITIITTIITRLFFPAISSDVANALT
ncbi:hypothetical protein BDZ90DRAFT_274151 [Jaminaea rosea]|uniref:Uncharacterized protein n=1 Tax=Jaminaea rosea TaxID=1569628 RepID=A0A316UTU3_9BASI|nr:hypothetical protein BDZ90DRAFT_274151 [Jaminaea rosea]PWN28414.1 hypothetical protein BDZ90DRAFT_274151 [Jaminaea rosea]